MQFLFVWVRLKAGSKDIHEDYHIYDKAQYLSPEDILKTKYWLIQKDNLQRSAYINNKYIFKEICDMW